MNLCQSVHESRCSREAAVCWKGKREREVHTIGTVKSQVLSYGLCPLSGTSQKIVRLPDSLANCQLFLLHVLEFLVFLLKVCFRQGAMFQKTTGWLSSTLTGTRELVLYESAAAATNLPV